jgi:hypothetical protein
VTANGPGIGTGEVTVYRDDGTIGRCSKFGPGEEEAARAFLEQPLENRRFWMIPNRRVLSMTTGTPIAFMVLGVILSLAEPDSLAIAWLTVGVGILLVLGMGGGFLIRNGLFVLDPEKQHLRYGKEKFPFSTMKEPRVTTARAWETRGTEYMTYGEVEYTVLRVGQSLIFQGDDVPAHKVEEIDDRLRSMLLEYREREEVRAWLRGRERELKTGSASAKNDPRRTIEGRPVRDGNHRAEGGDRS